MIEVLSSFVMDGWMVEKMGGLEEEELAEVYIDRRGLDTNSG